MHNAPGQSAVVTRTIFNYEKQPIARIIAPGSASAQETAYFYDPLGRLSAVVDPLGTRTEYGYDAHGNLNLVVADALATPPQITTYAYDDFGRLIRSDSPDAGTTVYSYDPRGNLVAKKDARNITTSYSYDDFDRLTQVDYPSDADQFYYYDGVCVPAQICPADWSYALGRLTGVAVLSGATDPSRSYYTYTYDARGQVAKTSQQVAGISVRYQTFYGYDAAGNLRSMRYPSGRQVYFDAQSGNPAKTGAVRTPVNGLDKTVAGNVIYSPFGGVRALTYGNGLTLSVTRDLRGFPAQISAAAGSTTAMSLRYQADRAGNITGIENLKDPSGLRDQSFGYDRLNQLTSASVANADYAWNYDPLGNRTREVVGYVNPVYGETTDYYYAPGTNRLKTSVTTDPPVAAMYSEYVLTLIYPKHHLPQGQPLQEQYWDLLDELRRLLDRADAGKKNVYLAPFLGNVRAFLNHAQLDRETMVRLLEENGGDAELADYLGRMLWWGNRMEDLAQWPQFQRDGLRWYLDMAEVVQIIVLEEDPIYIVREFDYDAAGSMVQQDYSYFAGDTISIDYTMNEAMRLEGVNYAGAGYGESYLYDHQNRRVAKQGAAMKIYHYDLAGNLIAEHRPDGSGLREWIYLNGERIALVEVPLGGVSIPVDCGGCGSLARPGENWVAVLLIGGPAFVAFGLARRKKKFMAAGGLMILGGILLIPGGEAQSQTAAERIYYYHNDHLGTPRVLTDESQTVAWELELSPFGDGWDYIGANSVNNPFRFPGQYDDEYAGLFYNWNRYYMPETGRYGQVDPIGSSFYPNTSKTTDPFAYTKNNPIAFLDATGLCCTPKQVNDLLDKYDEEYDNWYSFVKPTWGVNCNWHGSVGGGGSNPASCVDYAAWLAGWLKSHVPTDCCEVQALPVAEIYSHERVYVQCLECCVTKRRTSFDPWSRIGGFFKKGFRKTGSGPLGGWNW